MRDQGTSGVRGAGRQPAGRPVAGGGGRGRTVDRRRHRVDAHLAGRYGTETPAVLALADGRPELLEPLVAGLPYLGSRRSGPPARRWP